MKTKKKLLGLLGFALAFGVIAIGCNPVIEPPPETPPPETPPPTYTITYDGNGNTGGTVPVDSGTYTSGQHPTVLGNTGSLTKSGKVFGGWNTDAGGTGTWYRAGDNISMAGGDKTLYAAWLNSDEKIFWAMTVTDDTWYSLTAKKVGESTHCEVWADMSLSNLSAITSNGSAIANQYESKIYTPITDAFGNIEDVDGNGKVIFLLLDIIDGYTGTGGYVGGYFQPYQMYLRTAGAPYSNEADMLFMDTNPGFDPGTPSVMQNFYSTMVHELQHLIEWSETVAQGRAEKDVWINEGLSTGAEYIYGTGTGTPAQQTSRIDYFNSGALTATIPYGNNFFVWNGAWDNDVLADYATAYLFFQWLRIHASNDTGIYKEIIASTYGDYRAVTGPAASRIGSSLSSWETLLRTWFAANYIHASSGLNGYKNEITPTVYTLTDSGGFQLLPGEGVYSTISAPISPSASGNIKYAGIDSGTVSTSGPYTGGKLLTFNANTNNTSYSVEIGQLATSVIGGLQASVQMSLNGMASVLSAPPLPTTYPIDVHFGSDGKLSPNSPRVGTSRPILKGVPIDKN